MLRYRRDERGQAMIEFGFIGVALFMFTAGLVDVGRGFYQYNAIATAARFGARWGSVIGGTCLDTKIPNLKMSDWCNSFGGGNGTVPSTYTTTSDFWGQSGNHPQQGAGVACPNDDGGATYDWTVSDSAIADTTIVGAVRKYLDTDGASTSLLRGSLSSGFNRSLVKICIQMPSDTYSSGTYSVHSGDTIKVYAYYPFQPTGPLFGSFSKTLTAVSGYTIE